jgi:4-hydroxysphinganine ceramide fatty acyl 2-hydroxylase
MKHYVSNKAETPRMFENNFWDSLSRVHWTVPLWFFVPIIGFLLYTAIATDKLLASEISGLIVAGLAVWTFTEYVLHRFVFHYHPRSEWGKRIHWLFHGVHHDYPSDPLRLVMVPGISLPLATLFYLLFRAIIGASFTPAFMAGFLVGYLFYDMTHFAVHHFPIKGNIFGKLREHHMRHHFQQPDRGYGVSSPLWDGIFRTEFAMKTQKVEVTEEE